MIIVLDNYDSFTYNLVQLMMALGAEVEVVRNDRESAEELIARGPAGIVISPGPGTPDQAGISKRVVRLAEEAGIPLLGVCLGHQAVAEEFGARVVRGGVPVHGKTDEIRHDGSALFAGVSDPFTATRYHSLVVERESVPDELEVLAETDDGVVMALRHREAPVFGVQFHPESVLAPEGPIIVTNFLAMTGEIALDEAEAAAKPGGPASASGTASDAVSGAASSPAARPASNPTGAQTASGVVRAAVDTAVGGRSLSEEEAAAAMTAVMAGEATPAQIAALVTALRIKGETVDEITGFARAMREHAEPVRPTVSGYIDTCGTGGDGADSFNVSTVTAFVVAGAGVPIAKHGNRSVSSKCGSADVLEALGVRIDLSAAEMARCVDEVGVGFLFAQALHPSMRHAAGPRRDLAMRTVFNVLGPLTNPAGAKRQLLGVYDPKLVPVLAEVAGRLGAERVLVVHGYPRMDEVSVSGRTLVGEFDGGSVRAYEIDPASVGIPRAGMDEIAGGDAEENARIAREVLSGAEGPRRDVVLMNAAAALLAAGACEDLAAGIEAARRSIDSGSARERLEALAAMSVELAAAHERSAVGA